MERELMLEPTTDEAARFQEYLRQGLAEMDRLFEIMAQDQAEIDRLAASIQAKLTNIQANSHHTEAILATLRAA